MRLLQLSISHELQQQMGFAPGKLLIGPYEEVVFTNYVTSQQTFDSYT